MSSTFLAAGRHRKLFRRKLHGPWHVRFQFDGKDITRSLRSTDTTLARQRAIEIIDRAAKGLMPDWRSKLPPGAKKYSHLFKRLPCLNLPGIYVLRKLNKAVYVGQARNLLNRLGYHEHTYYADEILFLPTDVEQLNERERELIAIFKPPGNKRLRI